MSKINDPKIVTERLKKDIIKLVIDEVVIEGDPPSPKATERAGSVKIFATIPLPNKIHPVRELKSHQHPRAQFFSNRVN